MDGRSAPRGRRENALERYRRKRSGRPGVGLARRRDQSRPDPCGTGVTFGDVDIARMRVRRPPMCFRRGNIGAVVARRRSQGSRS